MEGVTTNFLPPKALQYQKRYLLWGLYKPWEYKMRSFIFQVYEMVDYLKYLPPFGADQGLPEDEILEFVEFTLPRKCQK